MLSTCLHTIAHDAVELVAPLVLAGMFPDCLGADMVVIDLMALVTTQYAQLVRISALLLTDLDLLRLDSSRVVDRLGVLVVSSSVLVGVGSGHRSVSRHTEQDSCNCLLEISNSG